MKRHIKTLSHLMVVSISCVIVFFNSLAVSGKERKDLSEMTLENGMNVIAIQDTSSSLVSIVVRVGAGAAYEDEQTSGMSHLLEHLLFDGTLKRSAAEIQDFMDENGAYLNAFTRHDYTAFESVVPSDKIELGFDVLSDMLFYSIIPEDQLQKERNVVIEEILKDLDNPATIVNDFFYSKIFSGTSYQFPVIGSQYNISTLDRDKIISYYRTYYKPNNMTLIIVGSYNPSQVEKLTERYFSRIPASPLKPRSTLTRYEMNSGEWIIKRDVPHTTICMALKAPTPDSKDSAAFEILSQLIAGSEESYLLRAISNLDESVIRSSAYYMQYRGFGFLELTVQCQPPFTSMQKMKDNVIGAVIGMQNLTFNDAELELTKRKMIADLLFEKEKFLHYARHIAHLDSLGDRKLWMEYETTLREVTLEDINNVAKQYLSNAEPVVTIVQPMQTDETAHSENSAVKTISKVLPNGLTVIIRGNRALPIIGLNVLIKNRSLSEKIPGISHIVSMMIENDESDSNNGSIADRLEGIGGRLKITDNPYFPFDNYYFTQEYDYLRLEYMSEFRDKGLELVRDLLFAPSFPEQELMKVSKQATGTIRMMNNNPSYQARSLFYRTLFGPHPFSYPLIGTMNSVQSMQKEDLIDHHHRLYQPKNMILTLVGDVDPAETFDKISFLFGEYHNHNGEIKRNPIPEAMTKVIEARESVSSEQAAICLGNIINVPDKDESAMSILFSMLSRRLQNSIREKYGYAYSVGAALHIGRELSWFTLSASTRPENLNHVIDLMKLELSNFKKNEFTEQELKLSINADVGRSIRYHQRRINQAHFLSLAEFNGPGYSADDTINDRIQNVTLNDIRKVSNLLDLQKGYVIAVVAQDKP